MSLINQMLSDLANRDALEPQYEGLASGPVRSESHTPRGGTWARWQSMLLMAVSVCVVFLMVSERSAESQYETVSLAVPLAQDSMHVVMPDVVSEKNALVEANSKNPVLSVGSDRDDGLSTLIFVLEKPIDYQVEQLDSQFILRLKNTEWKSVLDLPVLSKDQIISSAVEIVGNDVDIKLHLSTGVTPKVLITKQSDNDEYRLLIELNHAAPAFIESAVEVSSIEVSTDDTVTRPVVVKSYRPPTADQLLSLARDSIREGNVAKAEAHYQSVLSIDSKNLEARLNLVKLWLDEGRQVEAEGFLEDSIDKVQNNSRLVVILARLYIERDAIDSAYSLLRTELDKAGNNASYYALLAAVNRRQGDSYNSTIWYQKALSIKPDESLWWMGLGVSSEESGELMQAMQAYSEARKRGGLSVELNQFIRTRIEALSAIKSVAVEQE